MSCAIEKQDVAIEAADTSAEPVMMTQQVLKAHLLESPTTTLTMTFQTFSHNGFITVDGNKIAVEFVMPISLPGKDPIF
jgi:hypothetical protein